VDGQLGLQFGDALAGRGQFGQITAGRTGQLPRIDEVLATPDIDRLVADAEEPGNLDAPPSGCDEIENLAAELGRIAAEHHGLRRLLDRQLSSNPTPLEPGQTTVARSSLESPGRHGPRQLSGR
jgi:hypothetical protein